LNVVIFHDTSSDYKSLQNSICFDQDLPLPLNIGSKTYRICAFETGTFIRHGDGGCRNWGFGACFKRTNDKTVSFCRREAAATPTTTPQKATTTTRFTTTTDATTTRPTTRSVSDSRCPTGKALCNTEYATNSSWSSGKNPSLTVCFQVHPRQQCLLPRRWLLRSRMYVQCQPLSGPVISDGNRKANMVG
jgi:hypothetical protein